MPLLPSKQNGLKYGGFNSVITTGQRTLQLGGSGRTGLGLTAITLSWATPTAAQTLTIPDAGGNDTFVLLAATQTLTNKTITAPIFTGQLSLAVGTAALPSLTFTGDTDTGIYHPAANDVGIAANGLLAFDVIGVASAVNNITITNAIAAANPIVGVTGTDTNIGITFTAKGSGAFTFTTPSAPASVGTTPGTNANSGISLTAGIGGATSIATTGTGGNGGSIGFTTGAGAQATAAATAATGGNGGAWAIITGAGAIAGVAGAGTATGGNGGLASITAGNGGATSTSTGGNAGGLGGAVTITTGTGGAAAATAGTDTGGAGGLLSLIAGGGGNGADTGGAGGSVAVTAGDAGTGGNVAAGNITITPGAATGSGNGGSVTFGRAGTAKRSGVRNVASRNIESNRPTAPVDIAGGITATVTQMLEAGIFLCSASATLTLPAADGASGLVQALPGTPAVGDIISFVQVVAAAQTATLAVGASGNTLAGIATTAAATTGRRWIGRVTSVTNNSETITWY